MLRLRGMDTEKDLVYRGSHAQVVVLWVQSAEARSQSVQAQV